MNKNKNIIYNIITLTFIIALIFIVFINYNNIDNFYVGGVEKNKKKIKKRKIKKLGSKFKNWEQKKSKMEKQLESWNQMITAKENKKAMEKYGAANRAILRKMNLGKARRKRAILVTKMAKEDTKLINRRPKGMKKQLKRAIFRRSNIQKTENELQNLKENAAINQIMGSREQHLTNIARKLKIDVDSINSEMTGYSPDKRRMILAGLITEQDGFADVFDIENETKKLNIMELQKTLSNKKLAKNLESVKVGQLDVQIKEKLDSLKDKMQGINLSSISRKLRLRKQSEVQEEEPESEGQEEEQMRALANLELPNWRGQGRDIRFDDI